jgi:RNA polymerase sigma factor (sigma-70 family)
MPLFMDMHSLDGPVTIDQTAKAHAADLHTQSEHDMRYLRYCVDEHHGKIFCLINAPDADAAPDRSIIVAALGRLSRAYRQILIETALRGNTLQVTAARLGIPAGTVRSRLHYAMHQLRRELDVARVVQESE